MPPCKDCEPSLDSFLSGLTEVKLTPAEAKLIEALREMPVKESWCKELGWSVLGEGDNSPDESRGASVTGWGTNLFFAFQAYGEERGEPGQ
jgi:hypothetical protein